MNTRQNVKSGSSIEQQLSSVNMSQHQRKQLLHDACVAEPIVDAIVWVCTKVQQPARTCSRSPARSTRSLRDSVPASTCGPRKLNSLSPDRGGGGNRVDPSSRLRVAWFTRPPAARVQDNGNTQASHERLKLREPDWEDRCPCFRARGHGRACPAPPPARGSARAAGGDGGHPEGNQQLAGGLAAGLRRDSVQRRRAPVRRAAWA